MIDQYAQAFQRKDRKTLEKLFSPDMHFQDPSCALIKGKEKVLKIYDGLFQNDIISVEIRRQAVKGDLYFVEFSLVLKDPQRNRMTIDGVDLIEIKGNQIKSIRAYLDTSEFVQKR